MEALLEQSKLALVQVTKDHERIYVSEKHGFNVEESPAAVCYCGTCRSPMERFVSRHDAVISCHRCALRIRIPKEIITFTQIGNYAYEVVGGPDPVIARNICGCCFDEKQIQVQRRVGSGAKVELVSCPQCSAAA